MDILRFLMDYWKKTINLLTLTWLTVMTRTVKSKTFLQQHHLKSLRPKRSKLMPFLNLFHRENGLYDEPGPNNTVILDLGGDGDCGYRAIARSYGITFRKRPIRSKRKHHFVGQNHSGEGSPVSP